MLTNFAFECFPSKVDYFRLIRLRDFLREFLLEPVLQTFVMYVSNGAITLA